MDVLGGRELGIFDLDVRGFADAFGKAPMKVRHTLVDHPLLQLDAIAELAERFRGHIERHRADLPLVVPGGAPELEGSPADTVRGIEENGCWLVFWYIEQDRDYKALLDACLDEAESYLAGEVGRTRQREAFLFLSAPNALTPVHFDPEHNFLLQIRGQKNMTVCSFPDAMSEQRELERYYDGGHRNLGAVPSDGETFCLEPGEGVYVPSFMPHWVQNGPRASVSLSITFRSRASLRAERVHTVNARLRRLKLSPPPPGESDVRDQAKEAVYMAVRGWRTPMARVRRAVAGVTHDSAAS